MMGPQAEPAQLFYDSALMIPSRRSLAARHRPLSRPHRHPFRAKAGLQRHRDGKL
ncbi:MAG: hypothetical protein JWM91_362 [Rhodospirillales bacterium]|nr:hypothetical protein [Rhodospirillales bacterium]